MTVYCYCEKCKYRSKRKSKAINKVGQPMYKCLRKTIVVGTLDGTDFITEHAECYSAELVARNILTQDDVKNLNS